MDARERQVSAEWHPTWNQEETWAHLEKILAGYQHQGIRSLVVFWDHGPWHVARSVRAKIAAYNRGSRQTGGMHVLLFYLPVKSPWLMPLEPVFGQTKRALGGAAYRTLADLQAAVERRLERRNIRVKERRTRHQLTPSTESN
jgi:transposase